jgi:hypothetical protein
MKHKSQHDDELSKIGKVLGNFGVEWTSQYFDLLKQVILDLRIGPDDERIAIVPRQDGLMTFNIGSRWVAVTAHNDSIALIVSLDFPEKTVQGGFLEYFTTNHVRDRKMINVPFPLGGRLRPSLYTDWRGCCSEELDKVKTSSRFRKFHSKILYRLITDAKSRSEMDQLL